MSFKRIDRISEEIKRELSEIVRELKDPRISPMTSVVLVNVTRDLSYAKVYMSVMGDQKQQNETIKALNNAAGFVRREIGKRAQLRYTPEFTFILDDSIEHGVHISKLLHNVLPVEREESNDDITEDK